mgnify:FL=1
MTPASSSLWVVAPLEGACSHQIGFNATFLFVFTNICRHARLFQDPLSHVLVIGSVYDEDIILFHI